MSTGTGRSSAASASRALLTQHAHRGARIRRVLRLVMVGFFVAVLLTEPPQDHRTLCWVIVGCYLVWTLAIDGLTRAGDERALRFVWLALFVDVAVLACLTLITDTSAQESWTPYLLINGFFLIPVMAAAQLNPWVCVIVIVPSVAVYLVSGLLILHVDAEPVSYVVLRTVMLAAVGLGAILLSRLQRSRVDTIGALLADRTALLQEMVTLQQREQRDLAETLHDGALQYVLGARQELDDAVGGDPAAAERIDLALREAGRLLRSTMTQLHPAVLDTAGLLPALRDLVETVRARGRFQIELDAGDWDTELRTSADELILTTARELLTNVVKHAGAARVRVELSRLGDVGRLVVADDGRGMAGTDLDARLGEGHLGLASRRIRLEAAGGSIRIEPAYPHGTIVDVSLPLPRAVRSSVPHDAVQSL